MKKIIIALLILFASYEGKAQASLGFANNTTPGLSDTLIKNSNVTYGVYVKNTGNQPLNTSYHVIVGVLDSFSNYTYIDSIYVNNSLLQAGDTNNVLITHTIDPLKFMDGGNTVVIWPAAPGVTTTDTIYKAVYVIDFQDIDELSENEMIIYPNPVYDILFIRSDLRLESVRIFDLNGKEVLHSDSASINLSGLTPNIYLIEITDVNGNMKQKKIMVK